MMFTLLNFDATTGKGKVEAAIGEDGKKWSIIREVGHGGKKKMVLGSGTTGPDGKASADFQVKPGAPSINVALEINGTVICRKSINLAAAPTSTSATLTPPPPPPPPPTDPPRLAKIYIVPPIPNMLTGNSQTFTAEGEDQYGKSFTIPGPVTWAVVDPTIGTIDATGKCTAIAAGKAVISAMYGRIAGSHTLDVIAGKAAAKLTTVDIRPKINSVTVDTNQQFTIELLDQYGNCFTPAAPPAGTAPPQTFWSTDNRAVGTIDRNGLFRAQANGSVTITAIYDGIPGTLPITVPERVPVIPELLGFVIAVIIAASGVLYRWYGGVWALLNAYYIGTVISVLVMAYIYGRSNPLSYKPHLKYMKIAAIIIGGLLFFSALFAETPKPTSGTANAQTIPQASKGWKVVGTDLVADLQPGDNVVKVFRLGSEGYSTPTIVLPQDHYKIRVDHLQPIKIGVNGEEKTVQPDELFRPRKIDGEKRYKFTALKGGAEIIVAISRQPL